MTNKNKSALIFGVAVAFLNETVMRNISQGPYAHASHAQYITRPIRPCLGLLDSHDSFVQKGNSNSED
jgi:hypothetical protein